MNYLLILFTTFSLNSSYITISPEIHEENQDYLNELLLEPDECASYWDITQNSDISISIETTITEFQQKQVENSMAEINSLNLGFNLSLVDSGGLITIEFLDKYELFYDGEENISLNDLGAFGYAITSGYLQPVNENCYYIDEAKILIDTNLNEINTSLTVFHEILHATGLGHSSCRSSIMYNKDGTPFAVPSLSYLPLDKVALEILYSSENTLINKEYINNYVNSENISSDNLCIKNRYEIVNFEDRDFVCDTEKVQSPCYYTIDFVFNTSPLADIWCDLNASECDDYPFKDWDAINFDEKLFYCNNEGLCIEQSNFDPNNSNTLTNFEISCGEEFCEYLSSSSKADSTTDTTQSNSQESENLDMTGTIGLIIILMVLRKLYLDTLKKNQINKVEIREESELYTQDFDGNFGDTKELFDENDFS